MKGWKWLSPSQIILEVIPVQEVKMGILLFLVENKTHSPESKVNSVPVRGGDRNPWKQEEIRRES